MTVRPVHVEGASDCLDMDWVTKTRRAEKKKEKETRRRDGVWDEIADARGDRVGTERWERDEGICLALDIKKEEKEKEDRGREREGGSGREERQRIQPSGTAVCVFGGGQSGSVCRTSPDTNGRDAVNCSVCVCVCFCSETRPTSDPCATHTPPSAGQESTFCFLWTEPLWECLNVCVREPWRADSRRSGG